MNFKTKQRRPITFGTLTAVLIATVIVIGIIALFIFMRPGPYAVNQAYGQDYIWSVEPRQNNSMTVWFRNAELGAYCTVDPTLIAKVNEIAEAMKNSEVFVYFTYNSINNGDAEKSLIPGTGGGCAFEKGGVTIYRLTGIDVIPQLAS